MIFVQGEKPMNCLRVALLALIFIFVFLDESFSGPSNKFNQLILAKSVLESKFGVRSVECFPFKENIGFTEDQNQLIERCLAGVQAFGLALGKAVRPEIHSVFSMPAASPWSFKRTRSAWENC